MTAPNAPKMVDQNWRPSRSTETALATVKLGHFPKGGKKILKQFLSATRQSVRFLWPK
jgi:hypothetical protein